MHHRAIDSIEEKSEVKLYSITDASCERSTGHCCDFYSEGDYWWPNSATDSGLPYVQKDGLSNPENFCAHRRLLINMSQQVAELTLQHHKTSKKHYAYQAAQALHHWFLNPATRMNPHLEYAQAIPGICTGRGIGIIDTLHLVESALAIIRLRQLKALDREIGNGLVNWFEHYLDWLLTSKHGHEEKGRTNNHGTCWHLQVAAFALLTDNQHILETCRNAYKDALLPSQMALDGSFPLELSRTKPYCYSLFNLEAMTALCQLLSSSKDNLFDYETPQGLCLRKGIEFIFPYLLDKDSWPYAKDIVHWDSWPNKQPCLLFAGLAYDETKYLKLWQNAPRLPRDFEAIRNTPVKNPELWLNLDEQAQLQSYCS